MCLNAGENALIALFMHKYGATKTDENYFVLAYYLALLAVHLYYIFHCISVARSIQESSRCELAYERVERQTFTRLPANSISAVERRDIVSAVLQHEGYHYHSFIK
jgi:hypothetical protein